MLLLSVRASSRRLALANRPTPPLRAASTSAPHASSLPAPVIDLSAVLESPDAVKRNLLERKVPLDPGKIDELRTLASQLAETKKEVERLRTQRNALANQSKGDPEAREKGKEIKRELQAIEPRVAELAHEIQEIALQLPNMSHPAVPVGAEDQARIVKTLGPDLGAGEPRVEPERDHLTLSSPSNLAWTDFAASGFTTGSSWPLLTNEAALLELALTNYAMSIALSHGFTPVLTPDVVRSEVSARCGFRPRADEAQQTYFLSDGAETSALCLAGTAEIPLVSMSGSQTFLEQDLPRKHVAVGRAFRAEAGARGADSRGLYRVHQFSKVEMVVVCAEEESDALLEELRGVQEEILGGLGLSLRVLDMPTQELGASAHRKYDIEAWMPGRGKWGELSSASNCTDYQSRRLGIRYRPASRKHSPDEPSSPSPAASPSGRKLAYAHTLNGTAAAIPRLIVALLENGAVHEEDGQKVAQVRLPAVLRPFWLGKGTDARIEWVPEGEPLRAPLLVYNSEYVVHPEEHHPDRLRQAGSPMLVPVGFRPGQETQPPHPSWLEPGRLSTHALDDHPLDDAGFTASASNFDKHDTTASTSDSDLMRLLGEFTSGPGALTPALSPSVQAFPSLSVSVHDPSVLPAGNAFVTSSALGLDDLAPAVSVHSNEEHVKPQPPKSLAHAGNPFGAGDMSLPFDLDFSKFSGFDTTVTAFPVLAISPHQLSDPSIKADTAPHVVDPLVFDSSLDSPLGLSGSLSIEPSPLSDLLASPLFAVPDSAVPSATISELPLPHGADCTPLFGSASSMPLPTPSLAPPSSSLAWFPPLPSGPSPAVPSSTILRPLPAAPSAPHPSPSMTPWTPALSYVDTDSAPTSSSSSSAKNKRAPTGFRQSSAPLLPLDAPIQPRNSVIPSLTSRKRKTAAAEKALAKRGRTGDSVAPEPSPVAGEELPEDIVAAVERKRLQNTLSARKSRARKQARLQELEQENEALKARVAQLERALGLAGLA
ncbi:serine-tRNA ligase [Rhodotorula toruloides]|uniref:serine--tRNA ligase n=1 Tax=Rhodotorula toruloides TaxID=5286 RepID=A0A511KEF5_RHOTO|nr:serine-tRNA ligase [Rhodotorula toruloides]